jgi:hypothetical protein
VELKVVLDTPEQAKALGEAAAGGIVDLALGVGVERVHAKVAALGVLLPALGEGDGGAAAVRAHIAAKRGDFERLVIDDDGDGAVFDAGRMRGEAGFGGDFRRLIRRELGGDVDVIDLAAHQGVAHTAADKTRTVRARGIKRGNQRLGFGRFEPGGVGDGGHRPCLRAVCPRLQPGDLSRAWPSSSLASSRRSAPRLRGSAL